MSTPFNFVTNHDTTGGNSGSPVVDRHGRIVALLFDGNRFAAGAGKFAPVNPRTGRSVSVDCRAIMLFLNATEGSERVVDEIRQSSRPAP